MVDEEGRARARVSTKGWDEEEEEEEEEEEVVVVVVVVYSSVLARGVVQVTGLVSGILCYGTWLEGAEEAGGFRRVERSCLAIRRRIGSCGHLVVARINSCVRAVVKKNGIVFGVECSDVEGNSVL
jgi:hypothetical protein